MRKMPHVRNGLARGQFGNVGKARTTSSIPFDEFGCVGGSSVVLEKREWLDFGKSHYK